MSEADPEAPVAYQADVETERIKEIFEHRRNCSHILTEASMGGYSIDSAKPAFGALRGYLGVARDLIDLETELGQQVWYYQDLGRLVFRADRSEITDTHSIDFQGLRSIAGGQPVYTHQFSFRYGEDSFLRGHEGSQVLQQPIPLRTLWNGYALLNTYLAERGFELDVADGREAQFDISDIIDTEQYAPRRD